MNEFEQLQNLQEEVAEYVGKLELFLYAPSLVKDRQKALQELREGYSRIVKKTNILFPVIDALILIEGANRHKRLIEETVRFDRQIKYILDIAREAGVIFK